MNVRSIFLSRYFDFQSSLYSFKLRECCIQQFFELLSKTYRHTFASRRKAWGVSREELLQMPYSTLGYQLGYFLEKHDFELLPKTENHDIFHLISGCQPIVKEEIGQQFLLFGNGKRSGLMYLALLSGLLLPEYLGYFKHCYQKGKTMRAFFHWKFQHLLHEDFDSLLQFIHHQNTHQENPYL